MDGEEFDKLLRTESVFRSIKTLEQSWVPNSEQKLYCRDEELKKLTAIHRPIIDNKGDYSTNTLILGSGGIGKTLTVKFFVINFKEAALKRNVNILVEYYDCLQVRTKSGVLRHISEKMHYNTGHGYSDNEIMQQILKDLKKNDQYLFIILDEVHNLPPDDLLALLNASIGFGSHNSRFAIICISRMFDWQKVASEKILSRIQESIDFKPYTKDQALKILSYRRNLAFRDGILEDPELELIANIVDEAKNMRVGIDIMRSCGLRCDEMGISNISTQLILESRREINPSFRADVIDSLKTHEKLTFLGIARTIKKINSPVTNIDDTYENYAVACEEFHFKPHVKISYRKYVRSLHSIKAILVEYLNPTVDKKGRQLQIKLTDISPEQIIEYLEKIIPGSEEDSD